LRSETLWKIARAAAAISGRRRRVSDGMALKETSINRIVETVNAICHSRRVENYWIGFTSWSARRKLGQYRKDGLTSHLVVLADKMASKDAIDVEKRLHARLQARKGSMCAKKYDEKRRERYYAS